MDKKNAINESNGTNIFSNAYTSTLSSKNQVTVPSKIREIIGAEPGDQIIFTLNKSNEVVVKVNKKDSLLSLFGSMPPRGNIEPIEWDAIRKQARDDMVSSNN
jgi:antitoxin PrlF